MHWMNDVALPSREFSIGVFLVLLLVLSASLAMFWVLLRRWTIHRQWTLLGAWASRHGFALKLGDESLPAPTELWASFRPRVRIELSEPRTRVLEIETDAIPGLPTDRNARWRVLIRRIEPTWPATALRPVAHAAGVIDLFSLSSYPSLASTDRFVVFGSDAKAARILSGSMLRALLPPDIGLAVVGQHMMLDFSHRAFDPIEFDRMIALAEQLATHLPELA